MKQDLLDTNDLDSTDLFAPLPPEVLDALREHATIRTLSRNEVLFHEGDVSDALYVIREGRMAMATYKDRKSTRLNSSHAD